MPFTHLEVHSNLTLLGATASPADLAAQAAADGLKALALTDTGVLYGAVAFARACADAGIRPIIGMAVQAAGIGPAQGGEGEGPGAEPGGRLVLLAKDDSGYRSLCYLSSLLQAGPAFGGSDARSSDSLISCRRPPVGDNQSPIPNPQSRAEGPLWAIPNLLTWDDLRAHRAGLICLSGGRQGWIDRYLRAGDVSAAQVYAARLAGIFGEDAALALELPPPQLDGSADIARARELAAIGRRLGLPVAAVQPVYCLAPGDASRLRLLAAIRCNCLLPDVPDAELPGGRAGAETHWLSPQQVSERFAAYPAAVAAAGQIAARCGECLPDGRPIWPAVPLPPGRSADEALGDLALAGLQAKYRLPAPAHRPVSEDASPGPVGQALSGEGSSPRPTGEGLGEKALSRLAAELSVIATHGYAPLFLVVADIVRFAREHGVPVSTRGSVANSLVAYCAGITDVDPVAHDLLFERFLSPARSDAPDIDLDLCSRRRDEVLEHVRHAYGADRVALVGAMNTMRPPSAVRAAAKAYGLDERQASVLAARLPRWYHYRPDVAALKGSAAAAGPDDGPEPDEPAGGEEPESPATAAAAAGPDDLWASVLSPESLDALASQISVAPGTLAALLSDARSIVGQPDHLSSHAGGVVITPGPLPDVVPVQWAPKGFPVTQYEHGDVAALGLVKLDLLGIRALTVLADAAELVRAHYVPGFRLEDVPFDDAATGDLLARGDTIGVFQCESDGARATLRKLRARTAADLAVANAFFKPGPAMGGMAEHFVRRYRGEEEVKYLHPALVPILGPTKGVMIFQEQVLRIVVEIAGLSWAEADRVRKGMSRMAPAAMAGLAAAFVAGCQRRPPQGPGLSADQARQLWEQVASFAGFGFNQGHATAYAAVSYRSAYLRAHWPAPFLCARLADAGGFHHPVIYMADALRLGFGVRPPHVNHSTAHVTLGLRDRGVVADHARVPQPERHTTIWLGLGQVRDLRRAAAAAIVAARERGGPYRSLADLLRRVPLQTKEIEHLIRCGALDGLAASRAAMLAEADALPRPGRKRDAEQAALQLAFDFGESAAPDAPPETAAERCAWEQHVLGLPLTALVDPLALLPGGEAARASLPPHTPLSALFANVRSRLPLHGTYPVTPSPSLPSRGIHPVTLGLRLPGWTGGPGFFFWDGATLITARLPKGMASPEPWRPLAVRGHPAGDGRGTWWLQLDECRVL